MLRGGRPIAGRRSSADFTGPFKARSSRSSPDGRQRSSCPASPRGEATEADPRSTSRRHTPVGRPPSFWIVRQDSRKLRRCRRAGHPPRLDPNPRPGWRIVPMTLARRGAASGPPFVGSDRATRRRVGAVHRLVHPSGPGPRSARHQGREIDREGPWFARVGEARCRPAPIISRKEAWIAALVAVLDLLAPPPWAESILRSTPMPDVPRSGLGTTRPACGPRLTSGSPTAGPAGSGRQGRDRPGSPGRPWSPAGSPLGAEDPPSPVPTPAQTGGRGHLVGRRAVVREGRRNILEELASGFYCSYPERSRCVAIGPSRCVAWSVVLS